MKRFKPDDKENKKNCLGKTDIYSLYNHNGVSLNNNELSNNINTKNQFIMQEIKQEPIDGEAAISLDQLPVQGIKRPGDPYEFDEEGGGSAIDGFKRGQVIVKEEPKDLKKVSSGNLFTSEGLQPSYKDLEQIFDNSDDTSSDETVS